MRPAYHFDPPLSVIPEALRAEGIDAFQTTLRDPQRFGKTGIPDEADQAAFLAKAGGLWGIAHGSLLINLASPEGRIRNARNQVCSATPIWPPSSVWRESASTSAMPRAMIASRHR
jgi:hypothetical protein